MSTTSVIESIDLMKNELYSIFKLIRLNFKLEHIKEIAEIKKIYDLFKNDILFEPNNNNDYNIIALYYEFVKKDYNRAKKYHKISVKKGNIESLLNLGSMSRYIYNDINKSLEYLRKAIKCGNTSAMLILASYYIYDIKVNYNDVDKKRENIKLGLSYYFLAYECGCSNGIYLIGRYFLDRQLQQSNDLNFVIKCFLKAIDMGNAAAMNHIALYYEKYNYNLAIKYYKMAIKNGSLFAPYNLACYYEYLKESHKKVIKYFKIAITRGYIPAIIALADYYCGHRMTLESLELCLENKTFVKRQLIIFLIELNWHIILNDYNYGQVTGTKRFSDIEKIKFLKLIKEFEFIKTDKISNSLKIILNNFMGSNNIYFNFNNKILERIYNIDYEKINNVNVVNELFIN